MNRREAYLAGWSTTPAPPTAAAHLAAVHETDGDVDDTTGAATFRLGALDGTWATFFDRRLALHADAEQAVGKAWKAYAATMDRTRARAALEPDADPRAVAAAILATGHPDDRTTVVTALAGQLRNARAEGNAGARILKATGATPPLRESAEPVDPAAALDAVDSWEIEFTTAWDALAGADASGLFTDEATGWMARILSGATTDVGRDLSDVVTAGGTYEDLLAAAADALAGAEDAAVKVFTDQAVSLALSQGALDLYSSEGITTVEFLTAADNHVCAACLDAESGNPWQASQVPRPGLHPHCRCVIVAAPPSLLL